MSDMSTKSNNDKKTKAETTTAMKIKLTAASEIVKSFNKHWENNLGNISSPALLQNWDNNFNAFNEIIEKNTKAQPSIKICCPSPTGSGKTQQIIHKAIDLYKSKIQTLIVTMRTEDADIIASQIKTSTHDDYVAVFHSNEISIPGVRKVEHPGDAQCLVITHEKFKRDEEHITALRDFIVIDEAIDVITHTSMGSRDTTNMITISEKKGDPADHQLQTEIGTLKIISKSFDKFITGGKQFEGKRYGATSEKYDALLSGEIRLNRIAAMMTNKSISPTHIVMGSSSRKQDEALRNKYRDIAIDLPLFFSQFIFMTRSGSEASWATASELIPGKSVVVMDATASVNKAYELYAKHQPDMLKILPAIECRNYQNVTLHTVRTATGRSTILGAAGYVDGNGIEKKKRATVDTSKFMTNVMKNSKPGEKILVVSFKQLEPAMITYASTIEDRTINIDHWGNLTGTNKYQDYNRIFILGLNHKPSEIHRSLHALIKDPINSFKENEENNKEMYWLATSDLVAEVIQAINRIQCRRVIDIDGNCEPANVYLTLPSDYHQSLAMISAIKSEMSNIQEAKWDVSKETDIQLARVFSVESFMLQLEVLLNINTLEVSLDDVLDALDMTKKQYRENIKDKKTFKEALEASPFFPVMKPRIGSRGRVGKKKELWFEFGVTKIHVTKNK